MDYQINIQDLFSMAFGLRRPIYVVQTDVKLSQNSSLYDPQQTVLTLPADETLKSSLGTAVLSPVYLEAGQYKERLNDGRIITVPYPELLLPATTLLEVNLKKVITKTPLVGGQGTFKEYISFDDYDVRIRSVFVGNTPEQVSDFLKQLMALWQVPKEINVACDYLDILGIEALVIENIVPQQLEGRPLMLPFEITCVSDKPTQLAFNAV